MKIQTCKYCEESLGFSSEYYIIREAVKPKGSYKRWKDIGFCCETCYLNGCKVSFETVK
jgi:hypothetical protein